MPGFNPVCEPRMRGPATPTQIPHRGRSFGPRMRARRSSTPVPTTPTDHATDPARIPPPPGMPDSTRFGTAHDRACADAHPARAPREEPRRGPRRGPRIPPLGDARSPAGSPAGSDGPTPGVCARPTEPGTTHTLPWARWAPRAARAWQAPRRRSRGTSSPGPTGGHNPEGIATRRENDAPSLPLSPEHAFDPLPASEGRSRAANGPTRAPPVPAGPAW